MTTYTENSATSIIDVHSHTYPEPYLKLLEGRREIPRIVVKDGIREFVIFAAEVGPQGARGRPMNPEYWDLDAKIAFMDRFGIERSVISLGNPWLDPFPTPEGDAAANVLNDILSEYEAATNGRLVGLGVLPTSSVEAAASSVGQIADCKTLYGAANGTLIAGLQLDDPKLDPFWEEAARCNLLLFIHPVNSLPLSTLLGYGQAFHIAMGFPMETTIAISRLVFGGVLERFPTLRILVAHGGGCLPYLAGRLDSVWRANPRAKETLPKPPSSYIQRLHLDALVYYEPAFQAAHQLMGEERLMFGSDHPFSIAEPETNRKAIHNVLGDGVAYQRVMGRNAVDIFGLPEYKRE